MEKQLYTPYGFRDLLFEDTFQQQTLRQKLIDTFSCYGYQEAETPTIEYLDVFSEERGSIATQDMYKFVDRDGEILVLRPDMTPALARMASFYYHKSDLPLRVASAGLTFRYNSRYSAKQRQLHQTGIELYGLGTPFEDAEVLTIAVNALLACEAGEFRITIGHARLVDDLMDHLEIPPAQREEWSRWIESRNLFALEQECRQKGFSAEQIRLVRLLSDAGGRPLLEESAAIAQTLQAGALAEDLAWLLEVESLLADAGVEQEVLFDPGMRPELQYYTGVIFKGYALGAAEPVLDGGRYDALLQQMGTDWAAIGFGIYQDRLLEALRMQEHLQAEPVRVLLTGPDAAVLTREAADLRAQGLRVLAVEGLEDEQARLFAGTHHCSRVFRTAEEGPVEI